MKAVKQYVLRETKNLPVDISYWDIMKEILFNQEVEAGLKAVKEVEVISLEEVKEDLLNG